MARLLFSSMILLTASRFSSAFLPAVRSFGRKATAVAGSDNDFDDFSSKVAFMFPGQGAQFVGMCGDVCRDVPAAKALFDEASEILGYDLLEVCTEGPKEKLDSTVISQPAIFVASMAAVEKLKQEKGQEALDEATCAMGLSLGEYSALCFSGALSFADGVKITKARGEAMQAASDAVDSGMVSVIGLDSDKVKELCEAASEKSGEKIQIANYLCKGNYAVSGAAKACDVVTEIAKPEFKARMTVRLAVAGAFHTGKKHFWGCALRSFQISFFSLANVIQISWLLLSLPWRKFWLMPKLRSPVSLSSATWMPSLIPTLTPSRNCWQPKSPLLFCGRRLWI